MPTPLVLGEFEQLVLLAVLRSGEDASALEVRRVLEAALGRPPSRGALYRTLDRLEHKGWLAWTLDEADVPERGGYPRRRFTVTGTGVEALTTSRATLLSLWSGLEDVLAEGGR